MVGLAKMKELVGVADPGQKARVETGGTNVEEVGMNAKTEALTMDLEKVVDVGETRSGQARRADVGEAQAAEALVKRMGKAEMEADVREAAVRVAPKMVVRTHRPDQWNSKHGLAVDAVMGAERKNMKGFADIHGLHVSIRWSQFCGLL